MSIKAIIAVIIVAVFIGVLYVLFEKSFTGGALTDSKSSSAQELSKNKMTAQEVPAEVTSLIKLPEMQSAGPPIDSSTDMLSEAEGLSMRDYSGIFEDFKDTLSQ